MEYIDQVDNQGVTYDKYGFVTPVWKLDKKNMSILEKDIADAMWSENKDKLHKIAPCNCANTENYEPKCKARAWSGCKGQRGEDRLYVEAKYRAAYEPSARS